MKQQNELTITQPVFYILLVLSIQKSHGYEIMKKVGEYSNGKVLLGPGTLYTAIKRLFDAGFICESANSGGDIRRKYYEITPKGMSIVSDELKRFQTILTVAQKHDLHTYIQNI